MAEMSRRKFLGSSAAAVIVAGTMAKGKVFGANERVRVAVCGVRGRGGSHIEGFNGLDDAEVVALVDPDERVLTSRSRQFEREYGNNVQTFTDVREVLARDDIDAISIATPNHWHSLMTIWGCESGKDVYVEKPLSHNVFEGRQLVNAAAKYGRVVMHGTQSRSDARWIRDINLIHNGLIGDIHMAKGFTYKTGNRQSIGYADFEAPPDHLDWTLWQGPAREAKYCDNYVHYNWHWFWEYGNGETGNQGVHQMDLAVWGMNKGLPTKVYSNGGRYHWDDQGETPNTQVSTFNYEDGTTLVFEIRNLGSYREAGELTTGNTFWGSDGYYVENKGFFDMDHKPIEIPEDAALPETRGTWGNFISSVKSRKMDDIRGTALNGHLSSAHCHIANAAYRVGRALDFDPKTERFVDADDANMMLTRNYRQGFEVPTIEVGA